MMTVRPAFKTGFVAATIFLSVLLTYLVCLHQAPIYIADIRFQIAVAPGISKPSLHSEKNLILSDRLLAQIARDNNLPPQTKNFRSFELGADYKKEPSRGAYEGVGILRKKLGVEIYPENSGMEISYKSGNEVEAREIVENIFEKYRAWRQQVGKSVFNERMIAADKNLAEKRESFLSSQRELLNFMEAQVGGAGGEDLKNKKKELAAKIESLKLRYGPKHPIMAEALRQQEMMSADIAGSADPAKIRSLRDRMERDFQALDAATRVSVILEQEKTKSAAAFEILPLGEVTVRTAPQYIFYKLAASALAGLAVSLFYLAMREKIRPVFYRARDLEKSFGLLLLGEAKGLLQSPGAELNPPSATAAEGLKALRQELKLKSDEKRPFKLVTVTSSRSDEGRSELVTGLGRLSARAGEKVLVLDADLRSPELQQAMPSKVSRNIVDYLSGQARIEDIIARTDASGLHVIYGTAVPNTALDLISSEKMKTLLHSLREVYDLVLVHAPVALRGPDARVLAAVSDATLYLVQKGKTPQKDVASGVTPFAGNPISGPFFVLVES